MASAEADTVTRVFRSADGMVAHALAGQLAAEGIEARVVGDFLAGAYGGLGVGKIAQVEIWTPTEQSDLALERIAAWHGTPTDDVAPRRFRFPLSALLGAMTVVAVYAAGYAIQRARLEQGGQVWVALLYLIMYPVFVSVALRRRRKARALEKSPRSPLD